MFSVTGANSVERLVQLLGRSVTAARRVGQLDDAPDDGTFNYKLATGGPDIREVRMQTTPDSGPRAGRKFVVAATSSFLPGPRFERDRRPQPESYMCSAKLGGKALRGQGVGRCTYAIPKNAKGKKLSIP